MSGLGRHNGRAGGSRRTRRNVKVATECRKASYVSRTAAEDAIKAIRRDHPEFEGGYLYTCGDCGFVHITSMTGEQYAELLNEQRAGTLVRWRPAGDLPCGHRTDGTDHTHVCSTNAEHPNDHQCSCGMRWSHK